MYLLVLQSSDSPTFTVYSASKAAIERTLDEEEEREKLFQLLQLPMPDNSIFCEAKQGEWQEGEGETRRDEGDEEGTKERQGRAERGLREEALQKTYIRKASPEALASNYERPALPLPLLPPLLTSSRSTPCTSLVYGFWMRPVRRQKKRA
jgi:hypothetical protein